MTEKSVKGRQPHGSRGSECAKEGGGDDDARGVGGIGGEGGRERELNCLDRWQSRIRCQWSTKPIERPLLK